MSDTPKTNALLAAGSAELNHDCWYELVNHANQLERDNAALQSRLDAAERDAGSPLHFVFSGEHPDLQFVEVETPDGKSLDAGKWEKRGQYWHLIVTKLGG